MQQTLTLEILSIGNSNLKQTVLEKLDEKQKFIDSKLKCKSSFKLLDKLKLEQEHIDSVKALLELQEQTIKGLQDLLQKAEETKINLKRINELLLTESNEYMNKYYNSMLKK